MQTQKDILVAISEFLSLPPQEIEKGADLREDLNLGPIEFNDLIADLSARFDVTLDPEDIANIQTVEDLIILIEDNLI